MNFKKYDEFIKENFNNMLEFEIYYNLKCTGELNKYNEEQTKQLIYFAHTCYLKDEQHLDLGYICDKIMLNAPRILYDDFKIWDLLETCYE